MLMYLNIMSTDSSHTEKFVYNFADINILRELKRIDGVGFVEIMGSRDYAMRVWLNPNRLAAYNMSPQEVTAAIRSQNIELLLGRPVSVRIRFRSSCNMYCNIAGSSALPKNMARSC